MIKGKAGGPCTLVSDWKVGLGSISNYFQLPQLGQVMANVDIMLDRRKLAVFGVALVLRLALIALFPSLPDLLTGRVEISTPVSSFKRRECLV